MTVHDEGHEGKNRIRVINILANRPIAETHRQLAALHQAWLDKWARRAASGGTPCRTNLS